MNKERGHIKAFTRTTFARRVAEKKRVRSQLTKNVISVETAIFKLQSAGVSLRSANLLVRKWQGTPGQRGKRVRRPFNKAKLKFYNREAAAIKKAVDEAVASGRWDGIIKQSMIARGVQPVIADARISFQRVLLFISFVGIALSKLPHFQSYRFVHNGSFSENLLGMKLESKFVKDKNPNSPFFILFEFGLKNGHLDNGHFVCSIEGRTIREFPAGRYSMSWDAVNSLVSDIRSFYGI
jgi:hypothetical protein